MSKEFAATMKITTADDNCTAETMADELREALARGFGRHNVSVEVVETSVTNEATQTHKK